MLDLLVLSNCIAVSLGTQHILAHETLVDFVRLVNQFGLRKFGHETNLEDFTKIGAC